MENSLLTLQSGAKTAPYYTSLPVASCRPVKVALLGVGRWGSHWLRHLHSHPQADLVAVVDASPDRLHSLHRQYQLEQALLNTDWRAALEQSELEAVVVVTPAASHFPLIEAALNRGCHVLAEKPLTLSPSEAFQLCYLAEQQQRQLVVDHTYLFHPAVQQGRTVVRQSLGELRYGYAARTHLGPVRQDVDALWDLAIHDIAIFNYWLNATPVEVQAQGLNWLQSGLADLVWVKLTYASGFEATVHLCWSNPDKQRRLSLVGSQAALIFDELAETPLKLLQGEFAENFTPSNLAQQAIDLEPVEPLQAVCSHFLDCVQQNRASDISSGWLGATLVKILAALTASLQQNGKPVSL
ncbi:MAG: Gfo/Idh/MocA family protein [Elainella sp.]